MSIRIASKGVPAFRHGGIDVNERWQEVTELSDKQRAALRDFHGRFIQVHPADIAKLGAFGLKFVDESEKLADAPKSDGKSDKKSEGKKPEDAKDKKSGEQKPAETQTAKTDANAGDGKKG